MHLNKSSIGLLANVVEDEFWLFHNRWESAYSFNVYFAALSCLNEFEVERGVDVADGVSAEVQNKNHLGLCWAHPPC